MVKSWIITHKIYNMCKVTEGIHGCIHVRWCWCVAVAISQSLAETFEDLQLYSIANVLNIMWRTYTCLLLLNLLYATHTYEVICSFWWMMISFVSSNTSYWLLHYYQWKADALRAGVQASIFVKLALSGTVYSVIPFSTVTLCFIFKKKYVSFEGSMQFSLT